jgi:hypothetical protein
VGESWPYPFVRARLAESGVEGVDAREVLAASLSSLSSISDLLRL